jgi:hypothetical protein
MFYTFNSNNKVRKSKKKIGKMYAYPVPKMLGTTEKVNTSRIRGGIGRRSKP